MYKITVEDKFSSAHQLRGYKGKCENLHGHNWRILVTVKGKTLNDTGMLIDFHDLKSILKTVLNDLDHVNLNETPYFSSINPTAENISAHIFHAVNRQLKERSIDGISVDKAIVFESEGCSSEYSE